MTMTPDQLYAQLTQAHFILAGPCVLESFELASETAWAVKEAAEQAGLFAVFKRVDPVITDIHLPDQAQPVAEVADILQIPAFLCRQTDLLVAAAETGRVIHVKKGLFVAPWDMGQVKAKINAAGNQRVLLTERGSSFGYNNLVVDFRSIPIMQEQGVPVVFDATHSVQLPGGKGTCSGGDRRLVPHLARAAAAAGADGIFMECHPDPDHALCDGPNSWPVDRLAELLRQIAAIWRIPNDV